MSELKRGNLGTSTNVREQGCIKFFFSDLANPTVVLTLALTPPLTLIVVPILILTYGSKVKKKNSLKLYRPVEKHTSTLSTFSLKL